MNEYQILFQYFPFYLITITCIVILYWFLYNLSMKRDHQETRQVVLDVWRETRLQIQEGRRERRRSEKEMNRMLEETRRITVETRNMTAETRNMTAETRNMTAETRNMTEETRNLIMEGRIETRKMLSQWEATRAREREEFLSIFGDLRVGLERLYKRQV